MIVNETNNSTHCKKRLTTVRVPANAVKSNINFTNGNTLKQVVLEKNTRPNNKFLRCFEKFLKYL